MWVKSEYAGEVAVLSTWLCALLPWSFSTFQTSVGSQASVTAIWIRFFPGRFLYLRGAIQRGESPWNWVWEVPEFVATQGETTAAYVWILAVVVFLLPFAFSIFYYFEEERVEDWEYDQVRIIGGLLVASGLLLLASSGLLFVNQSGNTFPIGSLIQMGLGVILLRAERT